MHLVETYRLLLQDSAYVRLSIEAIVFVRRVVVGMCLNYFATFAREHLIGSWLGQTKSYYYSYDN